MDTDTLTMTTQTEPGSAIARAAMIDSQLRTSGVNEEFALARMMAVPREEFLPADKQALAYIDRSVAVSGGALASPLFYGKALIEAVPTRDDSVLVVEGGTGYLAALLAPMIGALDTLSAEEAVAETVPQAKYSLIMIDGAIEALPSALATSLMENGRIVSGLLLRQVTRLATGRKVAGQVTLQPVEDLGIPVLHPFDAPKKWTFS